MTTEREGLVKRIIIPRMKQLSFKSYPKFTKELGNLSQEAIYNFNKFLKDIEYDINILKRKSRVGVLF